MMYAKIENEIITHIYCGDKPEGTIDIPDTFDGCVGQSIHEFNDKWEMYPLSKRYADGFVKAPKGFKLDGEEWKELTQIEKYRNGIYPVPLGAILEGNEVRPMTREEKVVSKLMTKEEADEEIRLEEIAELSAFLTSTDWYATRMAETGKAIPEEMIAKRQAARERISELKG